jgi:hypothetical protein
MFGLSASFIDVSVRDVSDLPWTLSSNNLRQGDVPYSGWRRLPGLGPEV